MDGYPLAPMVLGLILGPIAESNLRRSLELSNGSLDVIYTSPIAVAILLLALVSLFTLIVADRRRENDETAP